MQKQTSCFMARYREGADMDICVFKVSLVPQENVIWVSQGLMVNQEFQELDSLGLLDLRVSFQKILNTRFIVDIYKM